MKDISNSVDDKLKIYASSQKVNIPDSYNLMVENRVDRCLKENVPAKYKIQPYLPTINDKYPHSHTSSSKLFSRYS